MRILLVAEEAAGSHALRLLSGTEHRVVTVLTSQPAAGRAAPVAAKAGRLGLDCRPAELVKDPRLADEIRAARIDILLNVHSLYIIRDEVLSAPAIGCFNLHPGPLPEYAGLDAPSWAIYNGEMEHGVSLHRMAAGIDTGPVAYAARFPIEPQDTGLSLSVKCVKAGLPLIRRLVQQADADREGIPRLEQDLSKRRYFRRRAPQRGRVDWTRKAGEIVNHVRACDYAPFPSPWGHPRTAAEGLEFGVAKLTQNDPVCEAPAGSVGGVDEAGARIATGEGWVLMARAQRDGRYVHPRDFLRPGMRLVSLDCVKR